MAVLAYIPQPHLVGVVIPFLLEGKDFGRGPFTIALCPLADGRVAVTASHVFGYDGFGAMTREDARQMLLRLRERAAEAVKQLDVLIDALDRGVV